MWSNYHLQFLSLSHPTFTSFPSSPKDTLIYMGNRLFIIFIVYPFRTHISLPHFFIRTYMYPSHVLFDRISTQRVNQFINRLLNFVLLNAK